MLSYQDRILHCRDETIYYKCFITTKGFHTLVRNGLSDDLNVKRSIWQGCDPTNEEGGCLSCGLPGGSMGSSL